MTGFVIEYHRPTSDYRVTAFAGADGLREAVAHRVELESAVRVEDGWEVVALSADSRDVLEHTHSRYFKGRELIEA